MLEEYNHKLDHLLVLLRLFVFLQDFIHVLDQCFDYFWRQEMLLVDVKLTEDVNLVSAVALFVWKLGQLHKQHQAQERQLFVLVVED